ncbi:DHA2 family efflux MFS transporter permease subunit [Virgisporangium ochraceum]|uniref:MFS transporter n=1 Tax=Virgisporangium ochraceum TaxID=65505 RepID=A0A8J4A616_9ACTN|nr:DHA2 family efflux MFS transporter permease subunit [Virgisporangium ochraceum]GIJ73476.1 MFS transporter [Virgisporangium ochraceum]
MERRWIGLTFLSAAVSLVIIDVTIINVAVPAIVVTLDASAATTQWIQEAYTLTLAALLIVAGRTADAIGRRRVLVTGLVIFTAASVLAATAPNGPLLVAARVLQGVGGAAILPSTLSLINATFRGPQRATAFAVWGSTIGAMAAVGPLLGGWLTTELSWRWAFWINLVLGPVAIVGSLLFVAESRQRDASRRLDLPGVLLSAVAWLGLVFGLIEGRTLGWWTARDGDGLSPVPASFAVALIALVAFVAWQNHVLRTGRQPLLDLRLFSVPAFARGNAIVFIVALGQLGLLFVLPLWLQGTLGYTATGTGLLLVPIAVGAFLAAATTPLLAQARGTTWVVRFGLVTEIAGLAWLAAVASPDVGGWTLVPALAIYGFGVGTADAQLPGLVLRDIPVDRSGQGSGVQSTVQELGSAMGIAVIGTVLFTSLAAQLERTLDPSTVTLVVESAGTAIADLDPDAAAAARDAFSTATTHAALAGAAFLAVGLLATASLRSRREADEYEPA